MEKNRCMEKPSALIVEDERDVAALFRHVLDLLGFQTEVVLHGQTAVERLSHSQPDLVLLDLNLPGVPGSRVLEMIRRDDRLSHTKVVVITGHSHLAGGLSVQPDLMLMKPVNIQQMTALISRITLAEEAPKAVPFRGKPLDKRTGLYNQPFFINRLKSSLRQAQEIDRYFFAVLLFKLEHSVNMGTQSHAGAYTWESILLEAAASLRRILRPTDTIARFESDTFYVLIENVPSGEIAVRIANRMQEVLKRNIPDIGNKIRLPIRVGILLCDRGYENAEMVLNDAKYAQALAVAQGDEYARYYYQVSAKK